MIRPRTILGCLAALVLGLTRTGAAAEFEAFDGLSISQVEIGGVPQGLADGLQAGLALTGEKVRLRRKYPVFQAATLAADRNRILLYLERHGYPNAQVEARVERTEDARNLRVSLQVDPGQPVQLVEIALGDLPPDLQGRVRRALPIRPGGRFEDDSANQGARVAEQVLQRDGYAMAKITPRAEYLDSTHVRLHYATVPGPRYVFGETRVTGIPADLVPVATRSIAINAGDMYSARALEDAKENLRILNLFRQVRLSTTPGTGDTLHLVAELSLREPHTVETKVGYLSEDKLRTRVSWEGRNTFGGGRGLRVLGSYSIHEQEVHVAMRWPALLAPRTREEFKVGATAEDEDAYEYWDAGITAASWYQRSLRTTTNLSVSFGYVDARFVSEEEDDLIGWMTMLSLSQVWDRTDDRLNPTRGWLTWGKAEYAPEFQFTEAPYVLGQVGTSHYLALPRRSVLATRVAVGLADALGKTERLLPDRRFYAGGANSNRGFERRALGPRDEAGNAIGGEASFEVQCELRLRLFWKFQGAVFFDIGQAWPQVQEMKFASLQPSAGYALMIESPVGPIRGDVGYRLRDPGNDPSSVFHFLIGHPF